MKTLLTLISLVITNRKRMPVITNPQEPSWESNVYFIVTTRIFVLMGTAYLIRSLWTLVSANWGSRLASTFACKQIFR